MTKLKFRNYTDRLDRTYQIKNTGVLIPGIFVNRLRDKLNTQKIKCTLFHQMVFQEIIK